MVSAYDEPTCSCATIGQMYMHTPAIQPSPDKQLKALRLVVSDRSTK